MMIDFDLNQNDAESLLRHCQSFVAATGDGREDRRLQAALEALQEALEAQLKPDQPAGH